MFKVKEGEYVLCTIQLMRNSFIEDRLFRGISVLVHNDIAREVLTKIPDLSLLSIEDQKEIGRFDVEKLSKREIEGGQRDDVVMQVGFKLGFQKHAELTADRRWTDDDVYDLMDYIARNPETKGMFKGDILKKFVASRPGIWDVEYENVDGKIKVLKILKRRS